MLSQDVGSETLIPEHLAPKPSPWNSDVFPDNLFSLVEAWPRTDLVGAACGYEAGRFVRSIRADTHLWEDIEFDADLVARIHADGADDVDFRPFPDFFQEALAYFNDLHCLDRLNDDELRRIAEGETVETPGKAAVEFCRVAKRDDWTRADYECSGYRFDRRYLTAPALALDPETLAPLDGNVRGIWIARPVAQKPLGLKIRSFENIDFASTIRPALVDGLLDREGLSVIFGPSGAGKSFVALDLAVSVATGRPWRGKKTEQAAVLFVAAEAPVSIERRILALRQRHEVADAPAAVVSGAVNLFSGEQTALEIIEAARLTAERFGVRVGWIVVDTLAAASAGSDENVGKDMGMVLGRLQKVQRATGAHVSIIHHEGKDASKGARGHSSLKAAVDTEINVRDNIVEVTKMRDGELGETFGFKIESVIIGQREDGQLVDAGVLVHEAVATTLRRQPLKGRLKDAADALQTALENNGVAPPADAGFSELIGHVVSSDEWRDAFAMATKGDVSPRSLKDVFRRARDKLATMGRVEIREGFCGFRD